MLVHLGVEAGLGVCRVLPYGLHGRPRPGSVRHGTLGHGVVEVEGTSMIVELLADEDGGGTAGPPRLARRGRAGSTSALLVLFQGTAGHDAHVLGPPYLGADDHLKIDSSMFGCE